MRLKIQTYLRKQTHLKKQILLKKQAHLKKQMPLKEQTHLRKQVHLKNLKRVSSRIAKMRKSMTGKSLKATQHRKSRA